MKYLLNCRDFLIEMRSDAVGFILCFCLLAISLYSLEKARDLMPTFGAITNLLFVVPSLFSAIAVYLIDREYPSNARILKPIKNSYKLTSMPVIDQCLHLGFYLCAISIAANYIFTIVFSKLFAPQFFLYSFAGLTVFGLLINRQGFRKIDHRLVKGIALLPGELLINTYEKQVRFQIDQLVSEYLSDDILKLVYKNPNGQCEQLEVNVRKLSTEDREKLDLALSKEKAE
ncbi:MAG: hypothetical protein AAFV95_25615 [Bacteroidota bacterium]